MSNKKFKVFIDDNFHYMDEDERIYLGEYDKLKEAIEACRQITEDSLAGYYKPGISEDKMLANYCIFGEDPFIFDGSGGHYFSARDYAGQIVKKVFKKLIK